MGHQALDLPVETWEHIIWLIPDSSDAKERWQCKHRSTFLACALVCKTWTLLARCRLLSLYFPKGKVKITNTDTIIDLIPIFQSPLRTLDPAFIRTLWFMPYTNPIFEGRAGHILNLTVLLLLDVSLFPSLQNLKFTKTLLSNGNIPISLPFPPTSVLSQIKSLTIFPPSDTPFENGIQTIQLCPSVEKVKLWHNFDEDPNRDLYKARRPPKSLRKLILDMPTLREMAKWLMRCQPAHTTISSLEIRDFAWDDDVECPDLRKLLDRVGPNLEEFTLDVPHEFGLQVGPDDYTIGDPSRPFTQATKNVRLQRLSLRGPPYSVVEIASYILKQVHFASKLEVLNINFDGCYDEEIPSLVKFELLDQSARTRPSLCKIFISSTDEETWEEVRSFARKYMPYCEKKGTLELKLHPKVGTRF